MVFGSRAPDERRADASPSGQAWPIPGTEIQVTAEVLNATERSRLARLGARILREKGIDVVATGNAPAARTTRIVIRRGSRESAEIVRRALGVGTVDSVPDPLLRLDVTVILGDDFQPVTPLHP